MFTITRFSVLVVATIVATASFAQTRTGHTGAQARQFVSNARFVVTDGNSDPTFVQFEDKTPFGTIASMPATFRLALGCDLKRTDVLQDKLGDQHFKYQETYNDLEIRGAEYVFHVKGNNWVTKANGRLHRQVQVNTNPSITEEQALQIAIAQVGAQDYAWEDNDLEAFLRDETNNPDTTYFPQAELAISSRDYRKGAPLQLIYSFDVYASKPLGRYTVEVDAHTGEIVNKYDKIHHNVINGSGQTLYDGDVSMLVTEDAGNYYLGETTRGDGIYTYDMQNSTNYSGAQLFMESDSHFDEQQSQAGVSAHFGAGATYDYFMNKHGRNSFNGAGAAIRSYVHYSTNYVNAFWDGSRMTYGDGNGTSITALVSLDIVGHEIAHAVTQYSAGLIYQNESGALNESFSDIFGQSIEFETFPSTASWNLGDQIYASGNGMIRSISDPNSQGQPDTYLGDLWYTGSGDNGGVHYNSGVQNFWYYLLVEGGTGTNDFGYDYNVPTIGRDAADAIAYRNLTVYLTSGSTYIDARVGAEQSAIDLYGENSSEHLAVIEAWNAVGVPTTEPVLTVASSLDVGYGIINETSVVDLRIINSGFERLDVTRIDVGDAVFSPAESTFSVAPQASYDLGIRFAPTAIQQYTTEMTIYSNADTTVIALQGIGSDRPSITLSEDHFSLTHAAGELASYPVTLMNNHSTPLNFTLTTDAVRRPTPSFVPTIGTVTVGKTDVNAYRQVSSLTGTDTLSGYVWADTDEGVAFDWLDIQTLGTAVTLGDDDNSNLIPLGFDFAFFEDPYSSISISSNGWISFTETSFGLWTTPLPSNSAPRNVIAWMGHDLFPGGTCHYYQDADNDRFIVQFTNWTDWATRNGDYTIQIQLHKDGRILLLYQNIANPTNGSVGIQDGTKTQGLTIAYDDETFFRNNYAVEIRQDPRWLEPSIEAVTLAANESVNFNIEIDASQLVGGNYSSNILLGLPDFHTTIDSIKVDLEIDGVANLQAPNRLEFGNGFVGQEKEQLMQLINLGSDELVVQSIEMDGGVAFSTDANNFTIGPRQDTTVIVRFVAPSVGAHVDTLRLETNDPRFPVRAIALEGTGVRQPDLTVNPDSLGLTLQQGTTTTRTLVLSNVADAEELTFSVGYRTDAAAAGTVLDKSAIFHGTTPQSDDQKSNDVVEGPKQTHLSPAQGVAVIPTIAQSSLDQIKSALDQSNASITSLIPNRHDFSDGETGTNIRDGGEDMYDAGNFLSTNLGGPVDYTGGDISNHLAFGSASYFTAKYTGLFVLVADLDGVSNFKIEGNLGADGGGSADGSVLQINRSGKTYLGFVKRVFDAGDPSVNHLIIIESNGVATHEFSLNTNDDYHEVSNLNEVSRINYLLFSTGGDGDYLDDAKMLEIMEAFVDLTSEETWLTTEQREGTIAGGQSRDIEFTVDAGDLDPGDYEQYIVFSYNSPDSPLEVPVFLEVTGDAPGELSLDRNSIDFGVTTIGDTKRDSVLLTNGGPSAVTITEIALAHSDFEVDGSSFELAPNASRWIAFVYTAETEGSVAAEAVIRHDGAGADIAVTLEARGELAPGELSLDRNSIDFGVTTIGDTKRDSVLLTNGGPSAVTITEIALAHSDFEVDGSSFELAPNVSRWIPFVYTAETEGAVAAEAVIRHDGAGADIVVSLEARGELAPGELSLDRNSIDFGVTTIGDTKRDSILLTNGGPSAVTITEIALAHSDFEVDGSSFELAPNASRWIAFVYTAETEGSVAAEAVISHDGAGADMVITLEARGELAPGELSLDRNSIDFGVTAIGDTKRDSVLLTNGGPSAVTITEIALAHSDFEVDGSSFELAPNASHWIAFVYTAETEGAVAAEAVIRHDGAGADIVITLEARGELAPGELSLDRNSIDFGVTTIGDTKRDSILLTNGGPSAVTITEIALAHSDFEVDGSSFELAPNASRWIAFVYTAETEGTVAAEALISHDGAGADMVITLEARGELAPGELSLDRNSIDFGVTTIGDTKRDSVLLTNGGPSAVTITEIALAHSDFEADGSSFELAPNASRWIAFVYTAETEGSVAAEALIRHDGAGADIVVTLEARGELAPGELSLDRNSIDFGLTTIGDTKRDSVLLTNGGPSAVTITEIALAHSDFEVDGSSFELAPNASRWIAFVYTAETEGAVTAEAVIRHDGAGADIVVTLEARGELAPGELSLDRNSIDFGVTTIGEMKRDSVLLTNGGPSAVTITEIALAHSDFEVDGSSFELAPNASRWIAFVYTAETEGSVAAEAVIRHDGAGADIVITLEARGELAPGELSLDRNSIDFGVTTIGDTKRDSVLLTNGGPSAVTITEIALAHSDFEVEGSSFELAPNASRWIAFVYTAETEGSVAAEAVIRHDGAGADIVVTLEARGELAPGELSLDRNSIDFGVTTIGDTQRDSVLLTNDGPSAVTITEIALAHSDFEVDGSSFELAPNASRWIAFVYTAETEGAVAAEAVIRHDGAGADIVVTLEARGELAPGELSLDRNSIDFGVTTIGDTQRDSILLTNGGPSAVTIIEIALAHSDFEVDGSSFELAPNASRWIAFVYTAETEGSVAAEAVIRHDGTGGDLSVALSGLAEEDAGVPIFVSRDSLHFGNVRTSMSAMQVLTLRNEGSRAVEVLEVIGQNLNFSVTLENSLLEPGEEVQFELLYTPQWEGPQEAELNFVTSIPTTQPLTIQAAGTGVATYLEPVRRSLSLPVGSGVATLIVETNLDGFQADSEATWLRFDYEDGDAANEKKLLVSYEANAYFSSRQATIRLYGGGISRSVVVLQEPLEHYINLSDDSLTAESVGSVFELSVETSLPDWTVQSLPAWMSASIIDDQIEITCTENTSTSTRSHTLVIGNGDIVAEVYVAQDARLEELFLHAPVTDFMIDKKGGDLTVAIETNTDYTVSVDEDWLSVTKTDHGLNVSVERLRGPSDRRATIVLASPGLPSVDIKVDQLKRDEVLGSVQAVPSIIVNVYPNPAQDFLMIESDKMEVVEFYTARGAVVTQMSDIINGKAVIDLRSLEGGMYFLRIQHSDDSYRMKKVIVRR